MAGGGVVIAVEAGRLERQPGPQDPVPQRQDLLHGDEAEGHLGRHAGRSTGRPRVERESGQGFLYMLLLPASASTPGCHATPHRHVARTARQRLPDLGGGGLRPGAGGPALFTWFNDRLIVAGLGLIMLGMGMTLTVADFARVASRPAAVVAGFVAQFTIMPLAGWGVARCSICPRPSRWG